jgi:hypothetical protein
VSQSNPSAMERVLSSCLLFLRPFVHKRA